MYYIKFKTGIFRYELAYFESNDVYLMDGVIKKNNLTSIKFKKDELVHKTLNVRILFCTIKKKDLHLFEKCISDFSNKLMVLNENTLLNNINMCIDLIKENDVKLAKCLVEVK